MSAVPGFELRLSLAAVHLVYYELQVDIFANLYSGEEGFGSMTLSRLLLAFPNVRHCLTLCLRTPCDALLRKKLSRTREEYTSWFGGCRGSQSSLLRLSLRADGGGLFLLSSSRVAGRSRVCGVCVFGRGA